MQSRQMRRWSCIYRRDAEKLDKMNTQLGFYHMQNRPNFQVNVVADYSIRITELVEYVQPFITHFW